VRLGALHGLLGSCRGIYRKQTSGSGSEEPDQSQPGNGQGNDDFE
jgi:hypothetical protein